MPIYKDNSGCLVLHMGFGDIGVCKCRREDLSYDDELAFHSGPEGEIGRVVEAPGGITTGDLGCVVRMAFESKESIQVLIDSLLEIRDGLPERK